MPWQSWQCSSSHGKPYRWRPARPMPLHEPSASQQSGTWASRCCGSPHSKLYRGTSSTIPCSARPPERVRSASPQDAASASRDSRCSNPSCGRRRIRPDRQSPARHAVSPIWHYARRAGQTRGMPGRNPACGRPGSWMSLSVPSPYELSPRRRLCGRPALSPDGR